MNNLKFGVVFFVLFIFANATILAQISSSEVDKLVESAMQKFDVAGVAVGIVKDGKIIYTKGYGVKSIETNDKVNEHTNFAIASNSKAFTTAALAILVEEGKLSWTDKVKKHIPEFTMYNDYVTENFNIQDLLTHRSGLGLGIGDLMIFPDGADFTIDDILSSFQYFKPQSAFRTKFDYDNLLYLVAGEVIARVSGMSWEEFVKVKIFEPLEMDNTFSALSQIKDRSNLATPHSTETNSITALPQFKEMINGAAGGIYSNVNDVCNWMLMHLNEGKYGENLKMKLFSERNHNEMWEIHTTLPTNRNPRYNSHFSGYGLGWMLTDLSGKMSVSHTGGLPGMLSRIVMIPDLELGVVVLTNTSNGGAGVFQAVTQTIVDSYLGLDDNNWTDKYLGYFQNQNSIGDSITTKVWEIVKSAKNKSPEIENYIGVYKDNWFGKIDIFMKDGQLWFKSLRSPKINGAMYFYKANTFAIKWEYSDMNADAFAMFNLNEEGVAKSISMKGISPNIDFSFDFQDLDLKRVE
jgi:CubicO group peptidase (beta-lactamase class C family)